MRLPALFASLVSAAFLSAAAHAQAVQGVDGRWEGAIDLPTGGKLTGVFNVATKDGVTTTTFDSPDQGAHGMAATLKREGDKLTFEVPIAQMAYAATVSADGKTISGNVMQNGASMPLTMTKKAATPPAPGPLVAGLDGEWQGVVGPMTVILRIKSDAKGTLTLLDSPDEGIKGIPARTARDGQKVSVDIPGLQGAVTATLSADGKKLEGEWAQRGGAAPVTFERK